MTQTASLSLNPLSHSSLHKMGLFLQKMAPSSWWRFTQETEQAALANRTRSTSLPAYADIGNSKKDTPVLQFNKYLKQDTRHQTYSNTQPTQTCIMLDLDKDSAVYAFNCLTHEELRAKITARLIKQDIPFLTFASASGKTKIAIAVSLGKSKYIKRMEHSFTQEVVAEMLVKLGLTELAHTDYDSCHAGFWAFALTRQIGLEMTQTQFAHSLQQEPFDLAPIMYQIRQASSAKLSLKFDLSTLDSEMQAELAKLTERETTVLEYMLATASVDLENTGHITVSQQAVANAMECSISTVARALRSLVSKGLIKKTATGNIFTGCAQYTLSNDLWEAVLTSEEAAQKMEQKVIQVRRWNGLVPEPNKVVGSEEAMLTWLLENKPLIEGSRFSHYPAWYGGLSKVGYTTEMVIDTILIHNCGSRLSRSEVRSAINWLSRQDMRKAS